MTKFNSETEACIANAIEYVHKNPRIKMSQVAMKFAVPYDQFYRRFHRQKAGNTHGRHNKALNETEDGALK
jgi:hypothetical protein